MNFPKDIVFKYSNHQALTYIPWDEKYLKYVPEEFKVFFLKALPFMNVRTTNIHTAISLSFLDKVIELSGQKVNHKIIALGLILHDIGWSQLSEQEIIDSLSDYKGLELSKASLGPKERHALEGVKIAKDLLPDLELSPAEEKEILDAILLHDSPEKLGINGQLVADLDRLWSFTHENFWQDTIRKNVSPQEYYQNLLNEYEAYFSTEAGRIIAKEQLDQREQEIKNICNT